MPVDLSGILEVGVSSRVLFNLEKENELFEKEGIEAFRKHQLENEDEPLEPGTAFYLIKKFIEVKSSS
jgi:5'-nucleotidase